MVARLKAAPRPVVVHFVGEYLDPPLPGTALAASGVCGAGSPSGAVPRARRVRELSRYASFTAHQLSKPLYAHDVCACGRCVYRALGRWSATSHLLWLIDVQRGAATSVLRVVLADSCPLCSPPACGLDSGPHCTTCRRLRLVVEKKSLMNSFTRPIVCQGALTNASSTMS